MTFTPIHSNLNGSLLETPLYASPREISLTSLCEVVEGRTLVYFDAASGHLQSTPLLPTDDYYDKDYTILLNSVDEDQLYETRNGRNIYRNEHQLQVLLEKTSLPPEACVLDYGCAKGAMMKSLRAARPDVEPYLFDVSEMYRPFWSAVAPLENQATYQVPSHWQDSFDLIMSFFVLEHVEQPIEVFRQVRSLLKPDGVFCCIVPNVLTNTADLIVADHINHFSAVSLRYALTRAGFEVQDIDANCYRGAFVVTARRIEESAPWTPDDSTIHTVREQAESIAEMWRGMSERIRTFEAQNPGAKAAIYGSGFYGTLISTCLQNWENAVCFLDQNVFQQGKTIRERPILPPHDLPDDVSLIYVGLNPSIARAAMSTSVLTQRAELEYFYLEAQC